MSSENNWATARVTEAKAATPTVTDAASTRMQKLLTDQLSARQLSQKDLNEIAQELIKDMLPPSPKPESR